MSFWSGEKIVEVAKQAPSFLSDFSENQIDCNAYTLKMGTEFYVTADHLDGHSNSNTKKILTSEQPFIIPPGQFAFLLTRETLEIPFDVMAFISMKATYKFQGLINVSGFHVDPGYRGKLVFSVYNAGSSPVHLAEGLPLFLIWFADLDRISTSVRREAGGKTLSNDLLKGMSGKILSLQSLSEEIDRLRNAMSVQAKVFTFGITLTGAVFVALITFLVTQIYQANNKAAQLPIAPTIINSPHIDGGGSHL